jgi:hypothetical protein
MSTIIVAYVGALRLPSWLKIRRYTETSSPHAEPWDPEKSAIIDIFTNYFDAIDELKRLFLTGTVEVPYE